MKVIVTGGAGFLGSHLIDELLLQENQVICIDNLLTGSEKNISHLLGKPNFTFIKHGVAEKLPDNLEADQIYHLASPASPRQENPKSYQSLPFETMLVNTTGTWGLAELALKNGAKFLFASTSEVYGDPTEHPQKESYNGNVSTIGPRSVYDESKRFGETITTAFIREKKLDGRITRIFNTYGPRMPDDGRVVGEFVKSALADSPINVFGDGSQTRSFCYVSDLVEGLILAMNQGSTKGEVFNLGNPDELTIKSLAEKIKQLLDSKSEIVTTGELPEDDPLTRQPDITKAQNLLHWQPKIDLDTGLRKLLDSLK